MQKQVEPDGVRGVLVGVWGRVGGCEPRIKVNVKMQTKKPGGWGVRVTACVTTSFLCNLKNC